MANIQAYYSKTTTIAAAAGGTVVITKENQYDVDIVTLHVKNEHATVALDAAILEFKAHPDAGWVTVESTGWATADNIVLSAFNLATLAGATEGVIRFRTDGVYGWRLTLSANTSAGGPVQVWGVGKGEQAGVLAT